MMALLVLKSKIKNFYEKHYFPVRSALKTLCVFLVLLLIHTNMGYMPALDNVWLWILIAGLCGVTPDAVSCLVTIAFMTLETLQVSVMMSVTFLIVITIYLLLFSRMEKRQCELMLALPVLSMLNIGYVVVILAALFFSPAMIPAVIMGLTLQYGLQGADSYMASQTGVTDSEQVFNSLHYLVDYIASAKWFWVTLAAYCVAYLCIYFIRRGKFKHASQIAILVGSIVFMAVELISNILFDLNLDLLPFTIQVIVCIAIAYVIQFFHLTLDYHGTRKLQFEDDEYYYYVTAIPKYKVAVVDKTVTRIMPEEEEIPTDLRSELEKAMEEEMAETNNKDFDE